MGSPNGSGPQPNPPSTTPATAPSPYIRVEDGVMRIGDTRVTLDSILACYRRGESPSDIQRDFPVVSLEQVEGAIAYYLAHKSEVDAYLHSHEVACAYWRGWFDAQPNPVRDRLRALNTERAKQRARESA